MSEIISRARSKVLYYYKLMAVQPLSKIKIVKKITAHPNRFQGHQWKRLGVSITSTETAADTPPLILESGCPRVPFFGSVTNCARLDSLAQTQRY